MFVFQSATSLPGITGGKLVYQRTRYSGNALCLTVVISGLVPSAGDEL